MLIKFTNGKEDLYVESHKYVKLYKRVLKSKNYKIKGVPKIAHTVYRFFGKIVPKWCTINKNNIEFKTTIAYWVQHTKEHIKLYGQVDYHIDNIPDNIKKVLKIGDE